MARRLPAAIAAIPLPRMSWAKPLFASLQQAPPGPRPARRPFPPAGRLPFAMPCRILVRAHGRSCSQKLRPWRGMSLLSGAQTSGSVETQTLYLKKCVLLYLVPEKTLASRPARLPDALFPASWWAAVPGSCTPHILSRPISPRNRPESREPVWARSSAGPLAAIERWRCGPPWPRQNGPFYRRH